MDGKELEEFCFKYNGPCTGCQYNKNKCDEYYHEHKRIPATAMYEESEDVLIKLILTDSEL